MLLQLYARPVAAAGPQAVGSSASTFPVGRSGADRCDLRGWWRGLTGRTDEISLTVPGAGHQ